MIHLGGFRCCLGAIALYFLSRRTNRDVKFLESATKVDQLKDLAKLLQVESDLFPLIISVSGRVGSETPLKCEHSDMLGVILENTVEQQFLKRNWKFSWVQGSALLKPITKEVPWYLDDETGRVNVVGAKDAIGLAFKFGSEVFENSEPSSFIRATLDYLRGLQMLGVRRIERLLPLGTQLNVVGEAVKGVAGDVRIQKPEQGPFYVSAIPLDEFIAKSGKWSRWFKDASIGLTVLGVILITKDVIVYSIEMAIGMATRILENRRQQRLLRRRDREAAARRAESETRARLERQQENKSNIRSSDREATGLCVICLQREYNTAFVPCGHMCCCITCSSQAMMRVKTCPLCREPINKVLKIYQP